MEDKTPMLYEEIIRTAFKCSRRGMVKGMPGADQDVYAAIYRQPSQTDTSFQLGRVTAFLSDAIKHMVLTSNLCEEDKQALQKAYDDLFNNEQNCDAVENCVLTVAKILRINL